MADIETNIETSDKKEGVKEKAMDKTEMTRRRRQRRWTRRQRQTRRWQTKKATEEAEKVWTKRRRRMWRRRMMETKDKVEIMDEETIYKEMADEVKKETDA